MGGSTPATSKQLHYFSSLLLLIENKIAATIAEIIVPRTVFMRIQIRSSVKMPLNGAVGILFPIIKYTGRPITPRIKAKNIATPPSPLPCAKRWKQIITKKVKAANSKPPRIATFATAQSFVFVSGFFIVFSKGINFPRAVLLNKFYRKCDGLSVNRLLEIVFSRVTINKNWLQCSDLTNGGNGGDGAKIKK